VRINIPYKQGIVPTRGVFIFKRYMRETNLFLFSLSKTMNIIGGDIHKIVSPAHIIVHKVWVHNFHKCIRDHK